MKLTVWVCSFFFFLNNIEIQFRIIFFISNYSKDLLLIACSILIHAF